MHSVPFVQEQPRAQRVCQEHTQVWMVFLYMLVGIEYICTRVALCGSWMLNRTARRMSLPSLYLSVSLTLSVFLSVYLSVLLSVCLSINLSDSKLEWLRRALHRFLWWSQEQGLKQSWISLSLLFDCMRLDKFIRFTMHWVSAIVRRRSLLFISHW